MQVQHALRVEEYDADDADAVEASRLILDAARAVDSPFLPRLTSFRRTMNLRHGWDGSPERHLLCHMDGQPVAVADVELGEWDNREWSWFRLVVDPAHRRSGYGSLFLAHVLDLSRQLGRTKFGGDGWETPAAEPFALKHGFLRASEEVYRVVAPRELPSGLLESAYDEALMRAGDYELIHLEGHAPEELLPVLSELTTAINDAPVDELDIEDEVFPVERIRDYENATIDSGRRLYRIVARHRATGEPAGHTVVVVDTETPTVAHQHDTAVVRAHRGHRLGLLLKADMMRWLAEVEPQIATIDTFNAESNQHMIAVNERLGYRVVGRGLAFQHRTS
jgi:GNAT superfamily N-acetyltransferase